MGKKDIQQGDDEYQGCCRKCIAILECCRLAPGTGVKIVSIVSIVSFSLREYRKEVSCFLGLYL